MKETIDFEAFELDQLGRARLSDEDLRLIDEMGRVALSGGDGVNDTCTGSNGSCRNEVKCDGSSNAGMCVNATSCNTTLNKTRCMNQLEEQLEAQP